MQKRLNNNAYMVYFTKKLLVLFVILFAQLQLSAATFTVTNNANAGAGSLRQAILDANATPIADNIIFSGPFVITLTTGNLIINTPISIDGTIGGIPAIEITGAGIEIQTAVATASSIRGLNIHSCNRAIYVNGANDVIIAGNRIGTDATGMAVGAPVIAWSAIDIENATNTMIGGATPADGNIVSGANETGIRIRTNSSAAKIYRNFIGTNLTGTAAIPNSQGGIRLDPCPNAEIIGNIVSGNMQRGIVMIGSANVLIQDNLIGTNITGNVAMGNAEAGIAAENLSHNLTLISNVICSNGQQGVFTNNSNGLIIKGNRVGLSSNGNIKLGNGTHGIEINNSMSPIIGGTTLTERNYVSNNPNFGLRINNADNMIFQGNVVGLDGTLEVNHGNTQIGVWIQNSDNIIIGNGGAAARNYISANGQTGVQMELCPNPTIVDNYIGTNGTGLLAIGNLGWGLEVRNNSHNAIITSNVISANGGIGLYMNTVNSPVIKSNKIGLGSDASTTLGNGTHGMEIQNCPDMVIGGIIAAERNYVSDNKNHGMIMNNCPRSVIQGNYFGTDVTGIAAKGNTFENIRIDNSREVTLGGSVVGARNLLVASKQGSGVIFVGRSPYAVVKSNYVGVGVNGTTDLGNGLHGIYFYGEDVDSALVGGSLAIERNVSSGNGKYSSNGSPYVGDGIRTEAGGDNHIILGNYCGVDETGTIAIGNAWAGISLNECDSTRVGGPGLFEPNICSANKHEGMYLRNALQNTIVNNIIGTDINKTQNFGNGYVGIHVNAGDSFDNIIGGTLASANIIAYSLGIQDDAAIVPPQNGSGVFVNGPSDRNLITFNSIYCNMSKGITLGSTVAPAPIKTGNESISAPIIDLLTETTVSGTVPGASIGDLIHVYNNTKTGGAECDCEGEIYLGTTTVQAGNVWSFTHGLTVTIADPQKITATHTNNMTPHALGVHSTSEFSNCPVLLPVELLFFKVTKTGKDDALLQWATATEKNNKGFLIQRSSDGITFEYIGTVDGNGTKSSVSSYSFVDQVAPSGTVYYRFVQMDFDGKKDLSPIRSISFDNAEIRILPTSTENVFTILTNYSAETPLYYQVVSPTGQVVVQGSYEASAGVTEKTLSLQQLASAVYIIRIVSNETSYVNKLVVK